MRASNKVVSLCVLIVFMMSFFAVPQSKVNAVSSSVVISQVYGGGGNTGATLKNDFIELYNLGTSDVDLTGWTVQYGSAGGTSWATTTLGGIIHPGGYYLIQEAAGTGGTMNLPTPDATGTLAMSGTSGKVALMNSTTAISGACPVGAIDLVGYGTANCSETAPTPALTNTTAAVRKLNGAQDTDNNSADFVTGSPYPRNSVYPFGAAGAATPAMVLPGDFTLLTVAVSPAVSPASTGITVVCDLTAVGGPADQPFKDDGTFGDEVAGDKVFSFLTTDTIPGTGTVTCNVADLEGHSTTVSITVTSLVVIPIGTVQGSVGDTADGATFRSPYAPATGSGAGERVTVQGVIYEKTIQPTNSGGSNGFFIQNTAATADTEANSSDGIYVYMGSNSSMPFLSGPNYTPQVGDEVVITGTVSEYYSFTELSNVSLVKPIRLGVNLDAELPAINVDPQADLSAANVYWERMEGMRVSVHEGSIVLGGRNVFSPPDGEIWLAAPSSEIAQRLSPYERRAFRDAHPLDDNYDPNAWDGNGYRILLGSWGLKAVNADPSYLITPARTFDTLIIPVVGGLNYTYSKYRVEVTTDPVFVDGADPAANNPPTAIADRTAAYSIVDYNLENLYDYVNNPFSGCDFATDLGCTKAAPFLDNVNPPFNYVPASDADYQARLNDIALQIINDLHEPDVLMVQEVENQDICTVTGGVYACGSTNNADGKPDVLQELALKIASLGGATYDAAFDRDSSDLRGIAPAFLYRTDRVELLPAVGDPIMGADPVINYAGASVAANADVSNPKTFNAVLPVGVAACETSWVFPRAADVALFRIHSNGIADPIYDDVYVINNHFKSGPDSCVAHRTEQAKYNAALVSAIEAANPSARIVLGGDLNVYPKPDSVALGTPSQLESLYDPSIGLTNLWNVLMSQAPESAYSYVYLGMAQTLDQMFVNPAMLTDLSEFRIAHINSDFPAEYAGDAARGTSDHDPNVATFTFDLPPVITSISPDKIQAGSAQFELTVTGTSFQPDSIVNWNGTALSTTFISSTSISAMVPAALIASMGEAEITVISNPSGGLLSNAVNFSVYEFADVLPGSWYYGYVQGFYNAGMTTGCALAPYRYCPDRATTRAEAAVFILRALNGASYVPPAVTTSTFADVPVAGKEWMMPWIEQFYVDGYTTGCKLNPFGFCPERQVTRAEMAVFVLRAVHGAAYVPPAVTTSSFSDVPVAGKEWMMPWIEQFYTEGYTTGCRQVPTLQYCPEQTVTRAEVATFISRAFSIPQIPLP